MERPPGSLWRALAGFALTLLALAGLLLLAAAADTEIRIEDPGLEAAIREKLERPRLPLYRSDARRISEIEATGRGIRTLAGLEAFRNLAALDASDNPLEVLSALEDLPRLARLRLRNCGLRDGTRLPVATGIRDLDLRDNELEAVAWIARFDRLERLNLRGNRIKDIAALSGLPNLRYLNLHSNPDLRSIAPVSSLARLRTLILSGVPLHGRSDALAPLVRLDRLAARGCGEIDLEVIADLFRKGALQEDPDRGRSAAIDVRDTSLAVRSAAAYADVREGWGRAGRRRPWILPALGGDLPEPTFSPPAGFHGGPIEITLSSALPDTEIRYTLDGSEPTRTSPRYTRPIPASSRDATDGLFARPTTAFADVEQAAHADSPIVGRMLRNAEWRRPDSVRAETVIRAKAFHGDRHSATATRTYIVRRSPGADALPAVALTSDAGHLFDPESGIMVPGPGFVSALPYGLIWNSHGANYQMRGPAWERPGHVEVFAADGQAIVDQAAGIRIHGDLSRHWRQKSFRLYVGAEHPPGTGLPADILGGGPGPRIGPSTDRMRRVILRNSGNDVDDTFFRDLLMHDLMAGSGVERQRGRPVTVYLNGEFWGLYNLRERLDEHFLARRQGVAADAAVVIRTKGGLPEVRRGPPEGARDFQDLLDFARSHDLTDPDAFARLARRMDIDNYLSYQAAQIYADNLDWPHNNQDAWRVIDPAAEASDMAPAAHDGRWRWMLCDLDHGMGFGQDVDPAGGSPFDRLDPEDGSWGMFLAMLENEGFRDQFLNRMAWLLNTRFDVETVLDRIDGHADRIRPVMAEQIRRWQFLESVEAWEERVHDLRQFARERPDRLREHLAGQFGLPGTVGLTLVNSPGKGRILINGNPVPFPDADEHGTAIWTGVLFQGVPVEITAAPREGFRFTGWSEPGTPQPRLRVAPGESTRLTATFVGPDMDG